MSVLFHTYIHPLHAYKNAYIHTYIHALHIRTHTYTHTHTHTHTHIYIYIYIYIYISVCVCVCVCVCVVINCRHNGSIHFRNHWKSSIVKIFEYYNFKQFDTVRMVFYYYIKNKNDQKELLKLMVYDYLFQW